MSDHVKTFSLNLTKVELLHLRDLFSVILPSEMNETISQKLAQSRDRALAEARLWQKLAKACAIAKIPMNDDAPDFVVAAIGTPPIGVFEISHEEQQKNELFVDDATKGKQ